MPEAIPVETVSEDVESTRSSVQGATDVTGNQQDPQQTEGVNVGVMDATAPNEASDTWEDYMETLDFSHLETGLAWAEPAVALWKGELQEITYSNPV